MSLCPPRQFSTACLMLLAVACSGPTHETSPGASARYLANVSKIERTDRETAIVASRKLERATAKAAKKRTEALD